MWMIGFRRSENFRKKTKLKCGPTFSSERSKAPIVRKNEMQADLVACSRRDPFQLVFVTQSTEDRIHYDEMILRNAISVQARSCRRGGL